MRNVCLVLGWLGCLAAAEAPAPTEVRVARGEVELSNAHGQVVLKEGELGRLSEGAAPQKQTSSVAQPSEMPAPPNAAVPLEVQWLPETKRVRVDGRPIQLVEAPGQPGRWAGRSDDGRFEAALEPNGMLKIDESAKAGGRSAERAPDGVWTYRFGGAKLSVFASGKQVLQLPDGRKVETMPPVAPATPAHDWRIGVNLDATTEGRLVVGLVHPGLAADLAGFKPGDEVLAVEGKTRPTLAAVQEVLKRARQGERIEFLVRRGGTELKLQVVSGARNAGRSSAP